MSISLIYLVFITWIFKWFCQPVTIRQIISSGYWFICFHVDLIFQLPWCHVTVELCKTPTWKLSCFFHAVMSILLLVSGHFLVWYFRLFSFFFLFLLFFLSLPLLFLFSKFSVIGLNWISGNLVHLKNRAPVLTLAAHTLKSEWYGD